MSEGLKKKKYNAIIIEEHVCIGSLLMVGRGSVCLELRSLIRYPIVKYHSKLYSGPLPLLIVYIDMFFMSVRYRMDIGFISQI